MANIANVALLVDCNACSWGALAKHHGNDSFTTLLRAIQAFCNAHLSLTVGSQLVVIAAGSAISPRQIFSSRTSDSPDASLEIGRELRRALRQSARVQDETGKRTTQLARPFAHALCHLKYRVAPSEVVLTDVDASMDRSAAGPTPGRLVVLTLSDGTTRENRHLMNLFFSSQKMGIIVDVVALCESPLLQQAADITSGVYLQLNSPRAVLKALLSEILTSVVATGPGTSSSASSFLVPHSQLLFKQPIPASVDFRATCFCHGRLVSMAWVCSACLSVLCTFMPICAACGAVFKITGLPRKAPKKRKRDE